MRNLRLMSAILALAAVLALGACAVVEPERSHRYRNWDGMYLDYDPRLDLYWVVGYPGLYWWNDYYYREQRVLWERSKRHVGPWYRADRLPPWLQRRHDDERHRLERERYPDWWRDRDRDYDRNRDRDYDRNRDRDYDRDRDRDDDRNRDRDDDRNRDRDDDRDRESGRTRDGDRAGDRDRRPEARARDSRPAPDADRDRDRAREPERRQARDRDEEVEADRGFEGYRDRIERSEHAPPSGGEEWRYPVRQ
ncbi:MAG: hypothetical protein PHF72_07765 [Gammaproteobacteria bacterium]|nr:hypothetical protein [Gammaproteobacteria bacterium]